MSEVIEGVISKQIEILLKIKKGYFKPITDRDFAEILEIYKEVNKDLRMDHISREKQKIPATVKQKDYMHNLGIEFNGDITKEDASQKIEEYKRK